MYLKIKNPFGLSPLFHIQTEMKRETKWLIFWGVHRQVKKNKNKLNTIVYFKIKIRVFNTTLKYISATRWSSILLVEGKIKYKDKINFL